MFALRFPCRWRRGDLCCTDPPADLNTFCIFSSPDRSTPRIYTLETRANTSTLTNIYPAMVMLSTVTKANDSVDCTGQRAVVAGATQGIGESERCSADEADGIRRYPV